MSGKKEFLTYVKDRSDLTGYINHKRDKMNHHLKSQTTLKQ